MKTINRFSKPAVIIILLIGFCLTLVLNNNDISAKNAIETAKWEYIIVDGACGISGFDTKKTAEIMNGYGKEGWEHADFVPSACKIFMKRPLK